MAAAVVLLGACAGTAGAAKVRVNEYDPDYSTCKADCAPPSYEVEFSARPGEQNVVTATRDANGFVVLHDAGPAITTTRDCTLIDPHTVTCGPSDASLRVRAGDGDDEVTIADGFAKVEGGSGNDRLIGGPGSDTLVGGAGDDELHGGAGDDRLLDGVKSAAVPGNDLFDGGDGADWVDYAGRRVPVSVDLGHPDAGAGQAGEHDVLGAIENVSGGLAGDRLTGDESRNELDGGEGPGMDVLSGAGDNDTIWTRPGDRVFGGSGNDWIRSPQGGTVKLGTTLERIDCGPDADVIEYAESYTLVGDSCEAVSHLDDTVRLHLPLASLDDPVLTYDHYTDPSAPGIDPEHIELRASGIAAHNPHPKPGTLLAVADTGYADVFDMRLSDRGRALLQRYGRIRTRVLFGKLSFEREGYMIDLRAPAHASGLAH
jgi:hypothetical protein